MTLKTTLRRKMRGFLGITELEQQIGRQLSSDIVTQLEIRAQATTVEYVERHMPKAKALDNSAAVLDFALDHVPTNPEAMVCEFGVYRGTTINHIARRIKGPVYGFDSFEGLPEGWKDCYPKGSFKLAEKELPKCEPNVELIVGWFDQKLPDFVGTHTGPVRLLHIDCDLYSSTQTVFKFLGSRLQPGSVIVFDEYFNYRGWQEHEHRAFIEFASRSGLKYEYICFNRYSEQVAVRVC